MSAEGNDSPLLLALMLKDIFGHGAPQSHEEEFDRLAAAIFKGVVRCEIAVGHMPDDSAVDKASPDLAYLSRATNEPARNVRLKACALEWCRARYPSAGGFAPEVRGTAGVSDLMSGDRRIWVECGTTSPAKVLQVLTSEMHERFVLATVPAGESRRVDFWCFTRGDSVAFGRWRRKVGKLRSATIVRGLRPARRSHKDYAERPCIVCTSTFTPWLRRQVVCSKPACQDGRRRQGLVGSTEPFPLEVQAEILSLLRKERDTSWLAFFSLAFDTGLAKGTLLDLNLGEVFDGRGIRLVLQGGPMGRRFERPLAKATRNSLALHVSLGQAEGRFATPGERIFRFSDPAPNKRLGNLLSKIGRGSSDYNLQGIRKAAILRDLSTAERRGAGIMELRDICESFGLGGGSLERFLKDLSGARARSLRR